MCDRIVIVEELFLVELIIILVFKLRLALVPDRHHTVESFYLSMCFILVLGTFLEVLMTYFHPDRITDIVGILLYYHTELVVLKILVVLLFLGIFLYLKGYLCADIVLVRVCDSITVYALRIPLVSLLTAVSLRLNSNLRRYHKRRVEAYTELTDNVYIVLFCIGIVALEFE